MAWMSDEQYMMVSDSRHKKSIAASASKQRRHCGKSGSVKFPSDFMSRKEIKAMSGECVKYASLKKPMTWEEFKKLPDDLKVKYVKSLREKFNVPDKEIAEMFEVGKDTVFRWFKCLGLSKGLGSGSKTNTWNREGWIAWTHGVDPTAVNPSETPLEALGAENENGPDIRDGAVEAALSAIGEAAATVYEELYGEGSGASKTVECCCESKRLIPKSGEMSFEGDIDDILRTVRMILSDGNVRLNVKWEIV